MNDWFAFTEEALIVRLGTHEDIDDAFDAANKFDVNCIWVFQRDALEALLVSAQEALK